MLISFLLHYISICFVLVCRLKFSTQKRFSSSSSSSRSSSSSTSSSSSATIEQLCAVFSLTGSLNAYIESPGFVVLVSYVFFSLSSKIWESFSSVSLLLLLYFLRYVFCRLLLSWWFSLAIYVNLPNCRSFL